MRRFFVSPTSHRLRDLLLIGFALLSAAFVIAIYASVPGADGLIHGCYQANTGQLRVVDADTGTGCRVAEVAGAWPATALALACPAGTRSFVGVCIETTARPPDLISNAKSDCADEGKRLPSPGELLGFRELDGITLSADGEWTDDLGDTDPHFRYVSMTDTSDFVSDARWTPTRTGVSLAHSCNRARSARVHGLRRRR
jgi:hypothetical protein